MFLCLNSFSSLTQAQVYLTDCVHVLFQPDAVGHKPSGLTVRVKNGSEAGGFVVIQHQAQKAVAQILLAGPGETVATFTWTLFASIRMNSF